MNITRENVDELNAVLTLELTKEDYEERVNTVLKDYKKKANIPGFRPGKVPFGMIQKMYGKPVLAEEINKLVSENLSKYLVDEKLNILGEPLPHEGENKPMDFDNDTEFEFKFDLGIAPEFELKLSGKDKIPYYTIKIDKDLVQKYTDNYTQRFGEFAHVDAVEEKDVLTAKIVQLNEKDEVLEGGIFVDEARMATDVIQDADIKQQVLSAKKGDELVFDLKKAYPNDTEIASLLKIKTEEAASITGNFKVTVDEIQRFNKAEVNQELYDKIYGEGNVKSVEEFEAKIKEEASANLKNDTDYRFKIDTKENLVKKFKSNLPEAFLKRWLIAINEGKFTAEDIEKDWDKFTEDLKWQLIKDKIVKENSFEVTPEDIKAAAMDTARMQFAYYGMNNVPDEHLEQFAQRTLENQDEVRKLHEGQMEEKVVAHIKETVKVDEKEITLDKFNKLFEDKK
jgi:trigger factor